jgi:hypothetical protein
MSAGFIRDCFEGQIKEVKGAVKKLEEVVIASILMALEEIHA